MKTPERLTMAGLIVELTRQVGNYGLADLRCPTCDDTISFASTTLSIHSAEFPTCAGQGRVWPFSVPYCARCEPKPEPFGCIHLRSVSLARLSFSIAEPADPPAGLSLGDQMLSALKAQHEAIDQLLAWLAKARPDFYPSKCGPPWDALVEGNEAIARAERERAKGEVIQ
jgi:hypothetical protein